jgi:hypothetical protein
MNQYVDFKIAVDPISDLGHYPVRVYGLSGQEYRDRLILPLEHQVYRDVQMFLEYSMPVSTEQLASFGTLLFETLFHDKIGEAFRSAQTEATRDGKSLRIRLCIDPEQIEVAAVPWEFMIDNSNIPLAMKYSFCRFLPRSFSLPSLTVPQGTTLRMLITSALPKELAEKFPLDIQKEVDTVRAALKHLEIKNGIHITELPHLTSSKLSDAVKEIDPHIVHYVGHGIIENGRGALVLENDEGERSDMSATILAATLVDSNVRIIVLNSSHTSNMSVNMISSIAPALMAVNIPAVIATQGSFSDIGGLEFSRKFYQALGSGKSIDQCVIEGRKAIMQLSGQYSNDWGVITLYLRSQDCYLFDISNLHDKKPLKENRHLDHLKQKYDVLLERLHELELQEARFGSINAPVHLKTEVKEVKQQIAAIEEEIASIIA